LCIALFASTLTGAQAKVVYVNKNAPGPTQDGASWATAFTTVQAGINAAVSGDEVWVAKSTPAAEAYVENVTTKENVALYGGFSGTETERSQRNWKTNVTTIASPSIFDDVVTSYVQGAILDGFSIRDGDVGVLVDSGTATVTNCAISANEIGVFVYIGPATLMNCTISGNSYQGVWVDEGTATVTNCAISGNAAGVTVSSGTATVSNCTISSNTEEGVFVDYGTATVSNCAISVNNRYGIYVGSNGTATVTNSIVSFNGEGVRRKSTGYTVTLSHNDVYGNITANYSNIIDPTGTNGNISVDPLFVDRDNKDFHLQAGSPCIDAGDDSVVTAGQTDLDGKPRISGAHVDMGAYEFTAGVPPYALSEAVGALKVGAGLMTIPAVDMARMDLDADGAITVLDAARIARKVVGLDTNP
jgi:hypothetical protein